MLQLLDAEQRAALIAGIGGALRTLIRQFTVCGELRFAMHSHVARARR
jgi:hypothetical protein